jgi:hypothetical protein
VGRDGGGGNELQTGYRPTLNGLGVTLEVLGIASSPPERGTRSTARVVMLGTNAKDFFQNFPRIKKGGLPRRGEDGRNAGLGKWLKVYFGPRVASDVDFGPREELWMGMLDSHYLGRNR